MLVGRSTSTCAYRNACWLLGRRKRELLVEGWWWMEAKGWHAARDGSEIYLPSFPPSLSPHCLVVRLLSALREELHVARTAEDYFGDPLGAAKAKGVLESSSRGRARIGGQRERTEACDNPPSRPPVIGRRGQHQQRPRFPVAAALPAVPSL